MPPKAKGPPAESDNDEVPTYATMKRSKDLATGTVTFKPNQTTPEANDEDEEEPAVTPKRKPRGRKGPVKSKPIIDNEDESPSETGIDVDAPMDVDPAELVDDRTALVKKARISKEEEPKLVAAAKTLSVELNMKKEVHCLLPLDNEVWYNDDNLLQFKVALLHLQCTPD
ncbi:hypothetical protein C8J56DRAFT_1061866 [Mycena floridula]|nr:hypothetical protein C8J56DRAFT_1061866 [Mycena floridula]